MDSVLLMAAWLAPLLVLLLVLLPVMKQGGGVWLILAALPALAAALVVPVGIQLEIPWLLLGVQLGVGEQGPMWLFFASLLWLVAAWYSGLWLDRQDNARRFYAFFLLAMSGNFGVILAQDLISFYLAFATMGLSAYGLVVHGGKPQQRRAGRVYLVMTIVGELALFFALVMIYQRTGSLMPDPEQLVGGEHLEIGLLVLAFAIKAGVPGVHFWLPLAHPAAPVPASAVLSGTMIKAALIGWINFLPLGSLALPLWGGLLVTLGAAAAVLSIPAGLLQRDPKVLLAYSSIGKMGTMVAIVGLAMLEPELAAGLILTLVFFASHHGLAKGALFIGGGVVKTTSSRWVMLLLAIPALVMAGVPFTSGAVAKGLLKDNLNLIDPFWGAIILGVLVLTTLGTTLLMARFMLLMDALRGSEPPRGGYQVLPWAGLILVIVLLPLSADQSPVGVLDAAPITLALLIAAGAWWLTPAWLVDWVGRLPPGDFVCLLEKFVQRCEGAVQRLLEGSSRRLRGMTPTFAPAAEFWRRYGGFGNTLTGSPAVQAALWMGVTLMLLVTVVIQI